MSPPESRPDYITREDVVRLHARILLDTEAEGDSTEYGEGCIDGHLDAAWHAGRYVKNGRIDIPGLIFAGFAIYLLAAEPCFKDGNDDIAWAAGACILERHGIAIAAPYKEVREMLMEMRLEDKDASFVVWWLFDRLAVN